jgi:type IV pilus assembly protein PilV
MRKQRGISLVESLVALVVMSVGMLGIASLYVTSLQTSRSALTRAQAINLANDMADRIRANSRGGTAYDTKGAKAGGGEPPDPPDCIGNKNCTPAALALYDRQTWLFSFTNLLPRDATGNVVYLRKGFLDDYQIDVAWKEAGQTSAYNYSLHLQLYPVSP